MIGERQFDRQIRDGAHMAVQLAPPRPHAIYRQAFLDRIAALAPASLLDIGCGEGQLLRSPAFPTCARRVGVEVEASRAERLRDAGLDVRQARAEALPFADGSFDVVTFEFVAHHVEDLAMGLKEAARVARHAVVVLDGWYDVSIPSQQTAKAFDEWSKAIDRRTGMVHNPCPSAAELVASFAAAGDFSVDVMHRLVLQPLDPDAVEQSALAQLAQAGEDAALRAELNAILSEVRQTGISDDGAILFCATRTSFSRSA
jgi:SAM-dependent methyltransferase